MRLCLGIFLAAACLALPSTAAFAAKDCAPIGVLQGYLATGEAATYSYASVGISIKDTDGNEKEIQVEGATCVALYVATDPNNPMSSLEAQENYLATLRKLRATILWSEGRWSYANFKSGADDIWVGIYSLEPNIEVHLVRKQDHKMTLLPPSGQDFRLVGHMPNLVMDGTEKRNFDQYAFMVTEGDDTHEFNAKGARTTLHYTQTANKIVPSDVDIQTNYRRSFIAAGGQIVFADGRNTTARFEVAGQRTWIRIYSGETTVEMTVIEEKPFQPNIKPPEESALRQELQANGHVALW